MTNDPIAGGGAASADDRDLRLRRLRMRCWRRGVKEMDLILGGFLDACGAALSDAKIGDLEALIEEDDPKLYDWVAGRSATPERHRAIIGDLRAHHGLA